MEEKRFIEIIKSISLTKNEKESIKENLIAEMDSPKVYEKTPYSLPRGFTYGILNLRYVSLMMLFFVMGAGVSFAAEKSLPGDILYPVKIGFNEKIAGVFSVGVQGRANREALLITKRLEEARYLVFEEKFSEKDFSNLEDSIAMHTDNVKKYISRLQEEKKYYEILKLQTRLEIAFGIGERFFSGLNSTEKEISSVALNTRNEFVKFSFDRNVSEKSIAERMSEDRIEIAEDRLKEARLSLEEVEKLLVKQIRYEKSMKADDSKDVAFMDIYVNLVKNKIKTGEFLMESKKYEDAIVIFGEAIRLSYDIILVSETEDRLGIELEPSFEAKSVIEQKTKEEINSNLKLEGPEGEVRGDFKSNSSPNQGSSSGGSSRSSGGRN